MAREAYFASRALVADDGTERWRAALAVPRVSDEMLEALRLAAGYGREPGRAWRLRADVCAGLLSRSDAESDATRPGAALRLPSCAVRVCVTDPAATQVTDAFEGIRQAWGSCAWMSARRSSGLAGKVLAARRM